MNKEMKPIAALALLVLAACSGGGTGNVVSAPRLEQGTLALNFAAPAAFKAQTLRKALFLSPSTQSVAVEVTGIASPFIANVASGSNICTGVGAKRTCTISLTAPLGSVTFTATLYSGLNATGNVLGIGSATQTISAAATFSVSIGIDGVAGSVRVSAKQPTFTVGIPATTTLTVTVEDAEQNPVTGTYSSPISLVNSDTSGAFTLSPTSVTASTQTVTLTYSGAATTAATTISASAAGVPTGNIASQNVSVVKAITISVPAAQALSTVGIPTKTPLSIVFVDALGNPISGTYPTAISLVNSDTSGTFTLSPTSVTSSSQTVTLTYNGSATPATATISASASGVPTGNVTPQNLTVGDGSIQITAAAATTTFAPGSPTSNPFSLTLKDAGGNTITGTYPFAVTLTNSDASGTFTLPPPTTVTSSTQPLTFLYASVNCFTEVVASIAASAPVIPPWTVTPLTLTCFTPPVLTAAQRRPTRSTP